MLVLIFAALLTLAPAEAPICRPTGDSALSSWSGSLEELAALEAAYQRQYAETSGQAYPTGAPSPSPMQGTVRCSEG